MDSVQQEVDFKITFTKAALGEMKKFAEAEGVDYFRIAVLPGGCSGFKYDFNLIDNPGGQTHNAAQVGYQSFSIGIGKCVIA